MVERKLVWAALAIFITFSLTVLVVYSDPAFLLSPQGTVRVALQPIRGGKATWNASAPHVLDGSFSAALTTGQSAGDGGGVFIGPLSFPFSDLRADGITFWAYFSNDVTLHPQVNIVLDNGRILQGKDSTPVDNSITIKCELATSGCQNYASADLWVLMRPVDLFFFSSTFSSDPAFTSPPASTCTFSTPCPLATWQNVFLTSNVIQIQIVYVRGQGQLPPFAPGLTPPYLAPPLGISPSTNSPVPPQIVFIDDVTISAGTFSIVVLVEPESIASSDR